MIRFLHAADLHLCSPMAALSPRRATLGRQRQLTALQTLLQEAVARGAQLILLAGDVFDTPTPPKEEAARFFEILGALPVPTVIAPGNHDFRTEGGVYRREALPENVYVFETPQLACIDFPALGLAVYGYAFTAEKCGAPELGTAEDLLPNRVSILLAHGDLTAPLSPYAPIGAGQLERSGFVYAALGHIHRPAPPRRYGNTTAAYSGFFAGRGFDETGAGQALLVEINGTHVGITALESTADRFELLTVDCTGAQAGTEITERVREALCAQDLLPNTSLRVRLTGEVGLSCLADQTALLAAGEKFLLFETRDETVPIFDSGYLEKDPTLRGAFYRAMLPRLAAADAATRATAARALRMGLAALSGREV